MEQVIEVSVANFAIGESPQILRTKGLGSCVAVCLYDKSKKIGALLHLMLPHAQNEELNPLRFVDTAVPLVLRKLNQMGVRNEDLEAHVVGGASMFKEIEDYLAVGKNNSDVAFEVLQEEGISVSSQAIGGHSGRNLEFFLETGITNVTTKV